MIKKLLKIVGFIIITIILFIIGAYLYLTDFGRTNVLSNEPRKAKLEIPITYNIGWWANQNALTIDSLQIIIIESKLNLFNSKSLIAYKVFGKLIKEKNRKSFIKEVHISERINLDTTLHCDRIIEITPIIETKENNKKNIGFEKFEFQNEHLINSNHFGINKIKFICGPKEQTIELRQTK